MNRLLGKRISLLRNIRNLSQEQMAVQLGISRQRYAGIEGGTNNISLAMLSRVAEILEISVEDITRGLEETFSEEGGVRTKKVSLNKIFDMLDLFYANKHLYEKITAVDM